MRRILIILFVIFLFTVQTAFAWTDNFNDGSITDWNLIGSWTIGTPSGDNTNYVTTGITTTGNMTHNIDTGYYYYQTDFRITPVSYAGTSASQSHFYWYIFKNTTTQKGFDFSCSGDPITCSLSLPDTSYASQGISDIWYRLSITIDSSTYNANITISNITTGVIYNNQQISISNIYINSNNISYRLIPGSHNWFLTPYFDNIVVSGVSPQAASTITWGSDNYVKDDTATFTWALSDEDWASFDRYFVRFYKDGIMQDFDSFNFYCLCYSQLGIGQQTGSFSVLANTAGSYKVTLEKGTLSYTNITSDTTRVRDYSSAYLIVNKTVPYKTSVPVQYAFGFGGISLDYAIQSYYFDKDKNEYQFEHSFFGLNASGTRNVYFEKTGTYILKLRNVRTDKTYAQTTTEATFAIPETSLNITVPTLKIDASSYAYGETLSGNYTIDNTNFTAGVTYLDIRNVDNEILTEFYGSGVSWTGIDGQTGDIMITLLNSPASENFPAIKIFAGNNQLRLMLKNATGSTTIIKTVNFTILDTNTAGYGLKLSKYEVLTKETFYAYVTTPEVGARLLVLNPAQPCTSGTGNFTCSTLYNIELKNASKQTIPLVIKTEGTYSVLLNNPAGDTEIMQNVKVVKSLAPIPTTTETGTQRATAAANLLSSNIFWALIMTAGLMIFMAIKTKEPIAPSSMGMLSAGIFTFMGWLPLWIFIGTFTVTAYLLATKLAGQQVNTG